MFYVATGLGKLRYGSPALLLFCLGKCLSQPQLWIWGKLLSFQCFRVILLEFALKIAFFLFNLKIKCQASVIFLLPF